MNIKEEINILPSKPGCYIYYNENNQVIYVGKAKNLKKRVLTYFTKATNLKTTRLVKEINHLDYFVVNNEREALLLEENLIKKYRPKYNILLNDDKAYPYIVITNEENPEYKYVRKFDKKALRNFGPLPQGSFAREILTTLQRIYPLRRCKGNLSKPCLYYQIGQCSGACFKKVDRSYYDNQIKKVDTFFKGDITNLKKDLENKMLIAANNLQFEEAQRIKNSLKGIELALNSNDVEFNDGINKDVIAYYLKGDKIGITTLFYRFGKLLFKDEEVDIYNEQEIDDILSVYINQIYSKNVIPSKIIIPSEVDFSFLTNEVSFVATYPINKKEISLYKLAQENAKQAIIKSELSSQNVNNNEYETLEELMKIANLNQFPYHIEMFDISNIGNEFVTGSCVVYKNGKPSKNDFRKYNIEIDQKTDWMRMGYIIEKRLSKLISENQQLPNLIIVDGFKMQLEVAKSILSKLNLNINIIGLVKDEKHTTNYILLSSGQEIVLDRKTRLYNLLSSIQIRVDNFAKQGFRNKQNKSLLQQSLINIPGMGQKRIQNLFKKYSSLKEMKEASFDQLNLIIKNKHTTNLLIEYLNSNV